MRGDDMRKFRTCTPGFALCRSRLATSCRERSPAAIPSSANERRTSARKRSFNSPLSCCFWPRLTVSCSLTTRSVDSSLLEQCFDQRTLRERAVAALGNDGFENALHAPQVGDLRPDVGKLDGSDVARVGTRPVALVNDTQEFADFIEGEAELPRPQDEAKPPLVRAVIASVTRRRARRLTASDAPPEISGPAASAIAGDMVGRLAEQIGPGTATVSLKQDSSPFGQALEAALKGWGYAVVTDQKTDGTTRTVSLA